MIAYGEVEIQLHHSYLWLVLGHAIQYLVEALCYKLEGR
jgi:hypothetical protein